MDLRILWSVVVIGLIAVIGWSLVPAKTSPVPVGPFVAVPTSPPEKRGYEVLVELNGRYPHRPLDLIVEINGRRVKSVTADDRGNASFELETHLGDRVTVYPLNEDADVVRHQQVLRGFAEVPPNKLKPALLNLTPVKFKQVQVKLQDGDGRTLPGNTVGINRKLNHGPGTGGPAWDDSVVVKADADGIAHFNVPEDPAGETRLASFIPGPDGDLYTGDATFPPGQAIPPTWVLQRQRLNLVVSLTFTDEDSRETLFSPAGRNQYRLVIAGPLNTEATLVDPGIRLWGMPPGQYRLSLKGKVFAIHDEDVTVTVPANTTQPVQHKVRVNRR